MREKLIELLNIELCPISCIGSECHYFDSERCYDEKFADHLISNGVTVRKQGKWEQVFYHYKPFVPKFDEWYGAILKCSICGREEIEDDDNNYCPRCGADMRGEEHGSD